MTIKSIAKIIKKGKKIAILGHISPDLDCFGSAFSLSEALNSLGKEVDVFADNNGREINSFIFDPNEVNKVEFNPKNYDLLILVDLPNLKRLGIFAEGVSKHSNIVKIDHHHDECKDIITTGEVIEVNSASTSEMIKLLIDELGVDINAHMATLIYAGIASDTNSFINDNVTPRAMKIAAEMFEKGADVLKVNNTHFKSKTKNEWELIKLGYDKAEFYDNFAIIPFSLRELKNLSISGEGSSYFASQLIFVEGIKIGISMAERNLKTFYCSFRSVLGVRVDGIANALGGGGHKQSAACVITGSFKEVKKRIINEVKRSLKEQGICDD